MVTPASDLDPGPTATTRPSLTLDWAFSGINRPPFVLVSAAALNQYSVEEREDLFGNKR